METAYSFDGIRMIVTTTGDGGQVNPETVFVFGQDGSVISARYAGGGIRLGFLVGTLIDNRLDFRFAQVDDAERLDGGCSTCELSRTADGRIRMVEHFRWESRDGSGTNVFEQITT